MADATPPDQEGWQRVQVDPRVVAARVAGLSFGFLIFDDTGSEWTRNGEAFAIRLFPNRFVYSREQNRSSAPYLRVRPRTRRPSTADGPWWTAGRTRDEPAAGRRGDHLLGYSTRLRTRGYARVLRGAQRPTVASRVDPDGQPPGRSRRDASSRTQVGLRCDDHSVSTGRGWGRSSWACDDGNPSHLRSHPCDAPSAEGIPGGASRHNSDKAARLGRRFGLNAHRRCSTSWTRSTPTRAS